MTNPYEDKRFIDILKDYLNGTLQENYESPPVGDTLSYMSPEINRSSWVSELREEVKDSAKLS